MEEYKKNKLNKFFEEYPLYKEFTAVENSSFGKEVYDSAIAFKNITYSHYCEKENGVRTFETQPSTESLQYWGGLPSFDRPDMLFDENGCLNYSFHIKGICQSCHDFHIEYLIHVKSSTSISFTKLRSREGSGKTFIQLTQKEGDNKFDIVLTKVGMFPEQKINIDKNVNKNFDRDSSNWYYKALKCIEISYGIGAYAYFRRIIEKELIHIVESISELKSADPKLKKMVTTYKDTEKVYEIYENIYNFLPESLKSLGSNPLQALYKQTSKGLHELSDKECLELAEEINIVLKFVIQKINEEKSVILEAKEALKKLTN